MGLGLEFVADEVLEGLGVGGSGELAVTDFLHWTVVSKFTQEAEEKGSAIGGGEDMDKSGDAP